MKTPAQEIRELANKIAKLHESPMDDGDDFSDYELRTHGTELDTDDEGEGEGFTQKAMFDQLGKILDSQGNPNPVGTVMTDDGKELEVSPEQAKVLRMFITTDKVKTFVRSRFIRDIQSSNGLIDFLDVADYNEMANLFVKKYL